MPVLSLEAAKLDHATRARIPEMQARLKEAEAGAAKATDPTERAIWAAAAHHYQSAIDQLRFGPYGEDPQMLDNTKPAGGR